ncbi:hypothetical protein GCM10027020_36900 [Nocardioides salsibiostraticola]
MTTLAALPQTRVGRAPWVAAGLLFAVTAVLLMNPDMPVGQLDAFLPAFFAVVIVGDLLTSVVLVEHYRAGGGPRSLALSWAYVFSGGVVILHTLVFPGVITETGLFGAAPSSAPWMWAATHVGFPILLAVALAPWPDRFEGWISRIDRRARRIFATHAVILAVVAGLGLLATVGSARLPVIIVDGDYSILTQTYGPWIGAINVLALLAAVAGVASRSGRQLGVETWALVAVAAAASDAGLVLLAQGRFTSGWYGARAMALTAAIVVLISMLVESGRLQRQMQTYARQLSLQNDELLEAQGLRDHLIAVVTHEMRTPLGGLRGYLEVLHDGELNGPLPAEMEGQLPAGVRRAQDRCLMLTHRLTLLTEDLLAVASAKHGGLVVQPADVDLAGELSLCAAGFPDLDLRIDCSDTITVRVDPLRLQQILANLVTNAAKYGTEPITLHAGSRDGMGLIEVSDAGTGVPEDFVPYLFERYSRAPGATATGSGLGLSVVRDLLDLHGGSISYVPETHVFEALLPLAAPALSIVHEPVAHPPTNASDQSTAS